MEQINLHFTGDFHAITSAHNLLSALIDNHIYWGNKLNIDVRRVVWKRVMDTIDRSLRSIVVDLGGVANGYPRQDGFDITVASEIMAIFCLAVDLDDLEKRIGNITIGYTRDKKAIYAKDLNAQGPMTVLLKDAIRLPVTVAINHFITDTQNEVNAVLDFCKTQGVKASMCTHWSNGGEGATDLAQNVVDICNENKNTFKFLYDDNLPLFKKIEKIGQEIYHASEVVADTKVRNQS